MWLYIFWFLHQTTTIIINLKTNKCCISFDSYIKPQLLVLPSGPFIRCISFDSYIKPQLGFVLIDVRRVVYLLIPTSNHNSIGLVRDRLRLYIFWFLHQTTTCCLRCPFRKGCISFDSYIKPQLCSRGVLRARVVYLLIPTSNHNFMVPRCPVGYYKVQMSAIY